MPWEISAAMEKAVLDGKVSFSRSGATSKNVNWLSLIIPNDANLIKDYLTEFRDSNHIPVSLEENNLESNYFQERFDSSIKWIDENNHAVISNGPYYVESYAPESRTITVSAFNDESYPFRAGSWSEFENPEFPTISGIELEDVIQRGGEFSIKVEAKNTDSILYFLTNSQGDMVSSESIDVINDKININIDSEKLDAGTGNVKIFAVSDSVLKPDFYESSFIVTEKKTELPKSSTQDIEILENKSSFEIWIIPIVIIIGIVIFVKKRYSKP